METLETLERRPARLPRRPRRRARAAPSSNKLRRFSINLRSLTNTVFDVYVPPNPDAETRVPCLEGSSDRSRVHSRDLRERHTRGSALCERVIDGKTCSGKRVRRCTNWRSTRVKKVPPHAPKSAAREALDRSARARSMPAAAAGVSGTMSAKQVRRANVRSPLPKPPTSPSIGRHRRRSR